MRTERFVKEVVTHFTNNWKFESKASPVHRQKLGKSDTECVLGLFLYKWRMAKALVTPGVRPSYNQFTIGENRTSITERAHDWSQKS